MNYSNETKKIIFMIVAVIFVIASLCTIWSDHEKAVGYEMDIQNSKVQTIQNRKKSSTYTKNNVIQKYDKTEPNLDNAIGSAKDRLYKGLALAYGKSQTPQRFNRNKIRIMSLLGSDLGNKVLSQVKPVHIYSVGTKSYANQLTITKIGFGHFSPESKSIPIDVLVSYKTPSLARPNIKQRKTYTLYSTFQIEYIPQLSTSKQFQVDHVDNGLNNSNANPQMNTNMGTNSNSATAGN